MNRSDQYDPKAAQKQSVFSELKGLRAEVERWKTKAERLQGLADAAAQGITLQQFNDQKAVLRDLLVAVENIYLSTKDEKVRIPKDLKKAMDEAQKAVRPNTGSALLPPAIVEKIAKIDAQVAKKVSLTATPTGVRVSPA